MITIRLKTDAVIDGSVWAAGSEVTLSLEAAAPLLSAGTAEVVKSRAERAVLPAAKETATK